MMEHTRASHANVVWEELFHAIQQYSAGAEGEHAARMMIGLSSTLRCLAACARHRYGTRVMKGSRSADSMHAVMSNVLKMCSKSVAATSSSWRLVLFDANLHVMEGTWVVTSHEEDDDRTIERMRSLHALVSDVVRSVQDMEERSALCQSLVSHLRRTMGAIATRPFMLRGVLHVVVDVCDRLLSKINRNVTLRLLLDLHSLVLETRSNILRSADGRLTAHKRLRVGHAKGKDGVLTMLVETLQRDWTNDDQGEEDDDAEDGERRGNMKSRLSTLWDTLQCAQVVHDPTGRVRDAMDLLSKQLFEADSAVIGEAEKGAEEEEEEEEEEVGP